MRSGRSRTRSPPSRTSESRSSRGDRATVEWWAVSTSKAKEETLAGVSLLRFDGDGLVVDQRDYWDAAEGRREL